MAKSTETAKYLDELESFMIALTVETNQLR